ncbi:WEB family protein At1g12150-like [Coffea eugenioides]|uniref:WEB family protein At1g12150-like n=1 Tax=Coffea arabica TaxID=13443 RepID=A0ABM4U9T3_COFAR|nr:WEB family protein At1g12150-like [Coffea arabica]XP_027169153.1 WEB family protein At1g12150-like [Coffea eugenioides]
MAEIDTKSIESVQAAISLFGGENDQRKNRPICKEELDKENELENLLKDLANVKVQLEAKDSAYKQALLKLDHYQKTSDELSTLLKNSELEKDTLTNDCKESRICIGELESTVKEMANQIAESVNIREQLSHVLIELKDTQGQLLTSEIELAAAKDAKFEFLTKLEVVETAFSLEKLKTDELLRHVTELNETIMHLKMAAAEAEDEKNAVISEKEEEIQLAEAAVTQIQQQLESVTEQLELTHYLEKQFLDKSALVDSLQAELQKANALHSSSEKVAFDALCELNQLKADLELKEEKNMGQAVYITLLENELKELKMEHSKANEDILRLVRNAEEMRRELEKTTGEMTEASEKENEAQVEIAKLKAELHKGRSKIAAAVAAEERAKTEKSAVYAALQQLAVEAEEAKQKYRQLKASGKLPEESGSFFPFKIQHEYSTQSREDSNCESKAGNEESDNMKTDVQVTILKEEYESLVKKAKQADTFLKPGLEDSHQSENLKKELEIATGKIAEFRMRAEQAISRADAAERAKLELEEQIKKLKERKARRKAALTALREVSVSKEIKEVSSSKETSNTFRYYNGPKVYQPLGKVLNMKF